MRTMWLVLLVLLPGLSLGNSDVYQSIDQNGNVHFSDRPSPGAKKVNLSPTQTYSPSPMEKNKPNSIKKRTTERGGNYSNMRIVNPMAHETFRDPSAPLVVAIEGGELAANHKILLSLDTLSNHVTEPSQSLVFTLNEIPRGAHSVFFTVIDEKGQEVFHSEGVPFYMQLPRANMQQQPLSNLAPAPTQPMGNLRSPNQLRPLTAGRQ